MLGKGLAIFPSPTICICWGRFKDVEGRSWLQIIEGVWGQTIFTVRQACRRFMATKSQFLSGRDTIQQYVEEGVVGIYLSESAAYLSPCPVLLVCNTACPLRSTMQALLRETCLCIVNFLEHV